MAYHYQETGHTKPFVGGLYQRSNSGWWLARLRSHNEATGWCVMTLVDGWRFYISTTELSHWHSVKEA